MKIKKFLILTNGIAMSSTVTLVLSSCKDNNPKTDELETLLSKVEIDIKDKATIDSSTITLKNIKDHAVLKNNTGISIEYVSVKTESNSLIVEFKIIKDGKKSKTRKVTITGFKAITPKVDELETLLSKVEIDIKDKANIDSSTITLKNIKDHAVIKNNTGISIEYVSVKTESNSLIVEFKIIKDGKKSKTRKVTITGFKTVAPTPTPGAEKYRMPELYEFSKNKNLFVIKTDADKAKIIEQFDKAIDTTQHALRIDAGKIKIAYKKASYIEGFTINDALQNNMEKIYTNGKNKEVIGYTFSGSRKGIHVSKVKEKVYLIKWKLFLEDGNLGSEEFSQEINLN